MRAWKPAARLLALAFVWMPLAASVAASELLVMPYTCTMLGGKPLLVPSREQGHQIIGPREQRTFTACSPANPDLCRTWTVHRFTLDCDGERMPWLSVVAAASADRSRRAWVENGRLLVRMPSSWSFDPDDPCARRSRFVDNFGFGRMRRYCDDRRNMAPPPIVEMPAGFAPMLGIDAFFVRATPGISAAPPLPLPSAEAGSPPPPLAANPPPRSPKVASAEPPHPRHEAPRTGPPADTAPSSKPPPEATPLTEPVPQAKAPAPQPASAPKAGPSAAQKVTASPSSGSPVVPRIINRPDRAADAATTAPVDTPAAKNQVAPQAPGPTAAMEAPVHPKPDAAPDAVKPAENDGSRMSLLTFAAYSPAAGAFAAFMVLTLALLGLFVAARRREQAQVAGRPPRDLAAASLGKRASAGLPAHPVALRRAPPPTAAAVSQGRPSSPAHSAPTMPAGARRMEMPRTRSEAIEVLGMGVMPGASEAAMKKIVDGLRLSWHPDLAQDEADRRLREFRTKQINAAWDIIQGKRVQI